MALGALPIGEMLKLPGRTTVAWAVFDAQWYCAAYPDACAGLDDPDDLTVLRFYLEHGQQRGHSPNIWFDEGWHLKAYPAAAAEVREGGATSAFDAYCRSGFRFRSPHWLFDELQYRKRYPDLCDEALARDGNPNGYDHYLRHGSREGRIGHPLFDPALYRAQLPSDERAAVDQLGGYLHYLRRIAECRSEVPTTTYFDPRWYLRRYPAVAQAIAAGKWASALHHYLTNDTPCEFDPLPEFSESYYLERYKDVAAAVQTEQRRNGYEHFLADGVAELRAPCPAIDLDWYLAAHPAVRSELDSARARDAFTHYLTIGRERGLEPTPPDREQVSERQAAALTRRRAENLLVSAARRTLDFSCRATPALSVVLQPRDGFALSLMMLHSLRAGYDGEIELIVVDNAVTDDTRRVARFVHGARVLHLAGDTDFTRASNAALNCITADAVLFLDGAVEFGPCAIAGALDRLRSDPGIGAVGAKLVRAHGRLEAAGGIICGDGTALGYWHDGSPLAPEANFVCSVDFCSAAFLLVRTELLRRLDGFDETFAACGYAEVDLCLRIAEAGSRVVYDPAVVIYRLTETGVSAEPGPAQEILLRKHGETVLFQRRAAPSMHRLARASHIALRVLFIDDTIPLRRFGSGFVRSNDLIQVMASLGYGVTVYPINRCYLGLETIYRDLPDTVEVMHDRTSEQLEEFLIARQGYFDAIWVARTHNLDRIKRVLRPAAAGAVKLPLIVLDTEAIAALRQAGLALLTDAASMDVDAAIMREFVNADLCQSIIAVSAIEARKLHDLGFRNVVVIGHCREPQPTPRAFADRAGMLFLGAMHHNESPNRDALEWFVREVLPLIERSLGWETRLTVAGYVDPTVSLQAYHAHPRVTLCGAVDETWRLFDAHRIFVAPTRYAAGLPYKVHEAASYGLPVVASELLRQQLGWQDGRELIAVDVTDPAEFARRIVGLYRDPALWQVLRENALERVRAEHGRASYAAAVRQVLEVCRRRQEES
jgi:glycosyltransferase involved in cell wall biosynthesis